MQPWLVLPVRNVGQRCAPVPSLVLTLALNPLLVLAPVLAPVLSLVMTLACSEQTGMWGSRRRCTPGCSGVFSKVPWLTHGK